jgi:hypothetical protein
MPLPWIPLLAAGLDWLEGLLPLLFVLFWIMSQVWGVFRKVAGNGDAKPPRPLPRPAPRPVPEAPWLEEEPLRDDADVRSAIEKQIEEFLRETGSRPQPNAGAQPPRPVRRPRRPPPRERPAASSGPSSSASASAPVSGRRPAGGAAVTPLAERMSDIARHVEDAFADDLVHRKATAPAADRPTAIDGGPKAAAADLVAALRNPATLRQLILVREILERPVERW